MNFVTIADLENQVTEAVVGFEQHGFGVPVLRVRCNPAIGEPVYFPPCTADPDRSAERSRRSLALVLWPDGWLTQETLVEATHLYLRCSGEWGPVRDEDVVIRRWAPLAPPREPGLGEAERACPERSRRSLSCHREYHREYSWRGSWR